ncbi:MAG: DUF2163 domain-containing protein [Rhodobacter sp.]|nr:DUF2163 domain-containing protein [Rhodobacter sp.]
MTSEAMTTHLAGATTTLCRAWTVTRRDGVVLGFTDHDRDVEIDGVVHRAGSGLTARAIQQGTGLAVDNSEALGALTDAAISETDLAAGRYDGAEVRLWLANWADPSVRALLFRGSLGEVGRKGAEFRAELRGLSDALNQPVGLSYARGCSAVLGDSRCRFDLTQPGYFSERILEGLERENRVFSFATFGGFDDRWFEFGRVDVLTGAAAGLSGLVKSDRIKDGGRRIELWQGIRAALAAGDLVRFTVGCDKRSETCREKFANLLNFRGFPHIPGEDWLTAYPRAGQGSSGGSLQAGTST